MTLNSCAKYNPKSINIHVVKSEKNAVKVGAKHLPLTEFKSAFGKRSPKEYRPILLSITNKSNKTYTLDGQDITLNLASPSLVAKKMHFNTPGRVLRWFPPFLFVWPFIFVSIADGLSSSICNKNITEDIKTRALGPTSTLVIPPHSQINKVLFIHDENLFSSNFSLTLRNTRDAADVLSFEINI